MLSLYNHGLSQVPNEIKNNSTFVTMLDLAGNQLESIPAWINEMVNLTELNLGRNKITHIPVLQGLTALTNLNLYDNKMLIIPFTIFKLTALTKLFLDDNGITSIPSDVSNLSNLRLLSLTMNKLKTVPQEVLNLPNLTDLCLYDNPLEGELKLPERIHLS